MLFLLPHVYKEVMYIYAGLLVCPSESKMSRWLVGARYRTHLVVAVLQNRE